MKTTKEIVREKFLEGVTSIDCPCKTPDCKVKMYFPDDIINYFANLIESERAGLREAVVNTGIYTKHGVAHSVNGNQWLRLSRVLEILDGLNGDKRD